MVTMKSMAALAAALAPENSEENYTPATPEELKAALDAYNTTHEFRAGDLVTAKEGLYHNYSFSDKGKPAIFVRYGAFGSSEKTGDYSDNDMLVMAKSKSGDIVPFTVDSRFFQPYTPPAE